MDDEVLRWVKTLELQPHPEGGYFRETHRSALAVPTARGARAASTAIYFLVMRGNFSALHRIASDEVWHFHAGGALEIVTIDPEGTRRDLHLGLDASRGERPQHVVSAGRWFGARAHDAYALVSCTVAPGFDFADFELGARDALTALFPAHREIIAALTRI